jgi:hypothetical protein
MLKEVDTVAYRKGSLTASHHSLPTKSARLRNVSVWYYSTFAHLTKFAGANGTRVAMLGKRRKALRRQSEIEK